MVWILLKFIIIIITYTSFKEITYEMSFVSEWEQLYPIMFSKQIVSIWATNFYQNTWLLKVKNWMYSNDDLLCAPVFGIKHFCEKREFPNILIQHKNPCITGPTTVRTLLTIEKKVTKGLLFWSFILWMLC